MWDLGSEVTNKFLMAGAILGAACATESALLGFDVCGVEYNAHRAGFVVLNIKNKVTRCCSQIPYVFLSIVKSDF